MVKPYDRYVALNDKSKVLIPAKSEMLLDKKEKTITIFPKRKNYARLESIITEKEDENKFREREISKIKQGFSSLVSQDTVVTKAGNQFIVDVFLLEKDPIPVLIYALDKQNGLLYTNGINSEYAFETTYFYEYLNKIKKS